MSSNWKVSYVLGDKKEEVVTTPLSEKKSFTKDVEKGTYELADTLLMEKKPSTENVDKGTDELEETLFMEKKSSTKNAEKGTDELTDMLLTEKKYSTKDVDKGTDELKFTKKKVNTIHSKGLDHSDGQYIRSKGWFKLDIEFLETHFSKIHSYLYKALF